MLKQKNQLLVTIIFFSLLLTAYALNKTQPDNDLHSAKNATRLNAEATQKALRQFGFSFQEVAAQSGVNFQHSAPVLDPKVRHIESQIASMGAGVAVADFDNDGWNDFYVTNSGPNTENSLFRNKKDGTFEDVASAMGVADLNANPVNSGASMGAVWGDYDGDGYEDLFVYRWGKPALFHNERGQKFTDVSEQANLPAWVNANNAIWLDYDRDGQLDLFLAGYFSENINLWALKDTRIMPDSFEYAQNGGRKYLLRNIGGGKFEDVTENVGLNTRRWALATLAADLRGTGYPDIVIANDYGVTEYFANEGGKHFREIGRQCGIGYAPKSGMNASMGDVLNSGQPAIYVANITEPGVLSQRNNLWVPRAGKNLRETHYDNLADSMGVGDGGWSFGSQFGDLNNDGQQDLYLTNGYISGDRQRSYWYDYSKITGANSTLISDAKNWPPIKNMSLSGYQSKRVWLNDGAGTFNDVAQKTGVTDRYDGRAVALVDLWNRGVLDVIVANQEGPLLIYKNSVVPGRNWVQFQLEGQGKNRDAVGAQVFLFWDGKKQTQFVNGGEGFCAQNQRRLHFGLGNSKSIEKAVIHWPDGKVQTLQNIAINKINRVTETSENQTKQAQKETA